MSRKSPKSATKATAEDLALIRAAKAGNDAEVCHWLQAGASLNGRNGQALRFAAKAGHVSTVQLLVSKGADINQCHAEALKCAIDAGHARVVELLLDAGCNTRALGRAFLVDVAPRRDPEILRFLLAKRHWSPTEKSDALESAVGYDNVDAARVLIDSGAEVRSSGPAAPATGYDARQAAGAAGHHHVVAILDACLAHRRLTKAANSRADRSDCAQASAQASSQAGAPSLAAQGTTYPGRL